MKWSTLICSLLLLGLGVTPRAVLPVAPTIVVYPNAGSMAAAKRYHTSYEVADALLLAAKRHGIPRTLAFRIAWVESRYNTRAVSTSDAIGLVQVLPSTGRLMDSTSTRANLFNPYHNTDVGFKFLQQMHRRYEGDWWRALVAYNQGPRYADTLTDTLHVYADLVLRAR